MLGKKCYVVYVKEGNQTVDILSVIEAPVSLMEFENIRAPREMRGNVSRQVNHETVSTNETMSVTIEQMEDTRYIWDIIGLEGFPEELQNIARTRLKHPETTLKELGETLEPPVSKLGVNRRLRKPSQTVDDIRQQSSGK